jgi:short-subunit dehydrogenase
MSGSLRLEGKKDGIEVILVYPDATTTDLVNNSLGSTGAKEPKEHKGMSPEYVAEKIFAAQACSKPRVLIGLNGKIIYWLSIFAPSLLDRIIKDE